MNLKGIALGVLLALSALGMAYMKGHSDATDTLTIEHQSAQLAAARQLEVERETTQRTLAEISKNWQDYVATSQSTAARTVADLRSRNVGLSVQLADATVRCVTGDGRPLADGRAELRTDAAEFLIEQAQRADRQVKALQETVKTLQGGQHK